MAAIQRARREGQRDAAEHIEIILSERNRVMVEPLLDKKAPEA